MVWMTAGIVVSVSIEDVPPQDGLQVLPWARMKASWNAFWPVASITAAASGGLLSSGIRYGAEAYQLEPSPSVVAALAEPEVATAETAPASRPNMDRVTAAARRVRCGRAGAVGVCGGSARSIEDLSGRRRGRRPGRAGGG